MAKNKARAIQIAVYDMGNNPLPDRLIKQLEDAVVRVIDGQYKDKQGTVAHTVVLG